MINCLGNRIHFRKAGHFLTRGTIRGCKPRHHIAGATIDQPMKPTGLYETQLTLKTQHRGTQFKVIRHAATLVFFLGTQFMAWSLGQRKCYVHLSLVKWLCHLV